MNIVKLKNFVSGNAFLNSMAECFLTTLTLIRGATGGGYAEYGEDLILSRLFQDVYDISIDKVRYADIGANHWCRGSNSYYFYKSGAEGLLLEANPLLCKNLRRKRKKDTVINAAVDIQNRKNIPFYILSSINRSSIDEESVARSIEMGAIVRKVIQVPCICMNDLLEKYQPCPDLLTMDIEGLDYKVLRSVDLEKYKIKVIVVEVANDIENAPETIEEYMRKKGYCIHAKTESNVIYRLV